ncbi:MAG: acylneuraminate cytidylyltransferase [Chloroflexota bacterium]
MVAKAEALAVIPARGGSKSIPRKNIRPFAGHPLMAYSIAAGLQARLVSRVIVSTDDEEIADLARRYGAEVPFLRPAALAQDDTPDLPVFEHALHELAAAGYAPEVIVQLRPTSPLRPRDCIDQAVEILLAHPEADSVRGVVPSGQNPYKMWRIGDDGRMRPLLRNDFDEPYNLPRQALPQTYWQTGHIDVIRTTTILDKHSMSGEVILPLVLDARYTVDIDNPRDWERAEWLLARGDLEVVRPEPLSHSPTTGPLRPLPAEVELVVLDFDGVLTDDRVWVDEKGHEAVAAHRGDGWGIARLKEKGIRVVVLSTEDNPVVAARCRKLGIQAIQGARDKAQALRQLLEASGARPEHVVYLGNDVNDVACFPLVGCALVVADAHPEAAARADRVLSRRGGQGAVRELCDLLLRPARRN